VLLKLGHCTFALFLIIRMKMNETAVVGISKTENH